MKPAQLTPHDFEHYPAQGRQIALAHLALLRQASISILPTLLRDLVIYDWKFPAEQTEITTRLTLLEKHPDLLRPFASIAISPSLTEQPWARQPQEFIEALTAYLWSSQQMDAYRAAANRFVDSIRALTPATSSPMPRLVMVIIGRDAQPIAFPLFQKLSPHGQIWSRMQAEDVGSIMVAELSRRATAHPLPYAHWYLDGGSPLPQPIPETVTQLLYPDTAPIKRKILDHMMAAIQAGSGPELLRAGFDRLTPESLDAGRVTRDPRMQHFIVSLLTEGSGTQIFSTSFVQWSAREVLRRAQPSTMLVRFAPRQRQLSFNAMVQAAKEFTSVDPEGSLIDADMAAYYTFLEMKALPDSNRARLLVWLEGRQTAFAAGPGIAYSTRSDERISIGDLLNM